METNFDLESNFNFLKLILCVWCIRLLIAVIGKEEVAFFQL